MATDTERRGTPKHCLPTSEMERRARMRANVERSEALLGVPQPRGSRLARGGEVEQDYGERVPHDPIFAEFDSWCRGLEARAARDDGMGRSSGIGMTGAGMPCEVLAEVKSMLKRTMQVGSVPTEYNQFIPTGP